MRKEMRDIPLVRCALLPRGAACLSRCSQLRQLTLSRCDDRTLSRCDDLHADALRWRERSGVGGQLPVVRAPSGRGMIALNALASTGRMLSNSMALRSAEA